MKKLIALLLALVMVMGMVACGAKAEIYRLINQLVKEGKTVIMISSEMPEILGMCDRIMVMHEGHKMGELMVEDASQEKIMAMCT